MKQNEVIGIPTETVYGLAGNALNEDAVVKIFSVKERPSFDPLIVHVAGLEQAKSLVVEWPDWADALARKYWPGPLTLLLKKKPLISDLVTSGSERVGLRVPNHPLCLSLIKSLDFPLAAPSANPFGYVSPTQALHVMQQLGGKIPYILDGGSCNVGLESSIVGEDENGHLVLYRPGGISPQELALVCKQELKIVSSSSRPDAPGMLLQHYSPRKKLLLYCKGMKLAPEQSSGGIFFKEKKDGIAIDRQLVLSSDGSLEEAARNLFSYLRKMDEREDVRMVYTEYVPETGLGIAINDRLKRALHR